MDIGVKILTLKNGCQTTGKTRQQNLTKKLKYNQQTQVNQVKIAQYSINTGTDKQKYPVAG